VPYDELMIVPTHKVSMNTVRLISTSQAHHEHLSSLEDLIVYCARVSNPNNQSNQTSNQKLIQYLIKHKHWSPFEMASVCLEINTTRDIARQILRHRSFSFQEFSQRYSVSEVSSSRIARLQDHQNRQNSIVTDDEQTIHWWFRQQDIIKEAAQSIYKEALEMGIAKEVARSVLPEGLTQSRMYVHGTVRSWIHYCEVRRDPSTQREHREIADRVWQILVKLMPSLEGIM